MLEWNIDDAGKVVAGYTPVQNAVHKQTIVYPSMPTAPTAFGAKTLRLRFKAAYNRPSWRCEQPMELFFHYAGTGNPGQNQPNWLYYWSQIQGAVAGGGNGGKLSLGAGTINRWTWLGGNKGSTITLAPQGALSGYVGILAHEQKHENDFFDVIWQGGGYNLAADGDKDDLRDGFEIAQYGDTSKDSMYAFESEVAHAAWSDVRADVAAKDAVNAKLDIDSQDWSDLKVEPGLIWFFRDEDRQSEAQTCNPTTSGNHKQF
jgi:hypothetical protein